MLDEPSTGLHAKDIEKLPAIFKKFAIGNNTVVMTEHHLKLIAQTDRVIKI